MHNLREKYLVDMVFNRMKCLRSHVSCGFRVHILKANYFSHETFHVAKSHVVNNLVYVNIFGGEDSQLESSTEIKLSTSPLLGDLRRQRQMQSRSKKRQPSKTDR